MRLLALSKDTDGIVGTTTGTRTGSVTLSGGSVHVGTIARLFFFVMHTLDFFKRHLSHALHTLLRTLLSECECSEVGVDWRAAIVYEVESCGIENEYGWGYGPLSYTSSTEYDRRQTEGQ